jgi:two-component system, NtrC family, C4-dicarboxylate transport sensor histidine kinase DctB
MGNYRAWVATLQDDRKNATTPRMWAGTAFTVFLIIVFASSVPPISSWFGLPFVPALLCFLPSLVLGFVGGFLESRGALSLPVYGALVLISNALLQFFFAALVSLSRSPGSFVMASLLVLTMAFHGYVTRVSLRFPLPLLSSILGLLAAAALQPSTENISLFAFIGVTGTLTSMLMGQAGLREHLARERQEKLRQAIYYRALSEKVQTEHKLSERVVDLLRYNHDAGNTLSTMLLSAQLLEEQVARLGPQFEPVGALKPPVERLLAQLKHLKALTHGAHASAERPPLQSTVLRAVVESVVTECGAVYPGVKIDVKPIPDVSVQVQDGEVGLRRIVENILHNACQGDGERHAYKIEVEVTLEGSRATLRVTDDGPGFSGTQLEGAVTPFLTTKTDGSGLGLFSVTHLLHASGGALRRGNLEVGGAEVLATLEVLEPSEPVSFDPLPSARVSGVRAATGASPVGWVEEG